MAAASSTSRFFSGAAKLLLKFPTTSAILNLTPLPLSLISAHRSLCSTIQTDPSAAAAAADEKFIVSSRRTPTPSEKQFDSCISRLRPGFSEHDVAAAVRGLDHDPDLALDVFRWASLRPGYRHGPAAYSAALSIAVESRRFSAAETLTTDILSGACRPSPDLELINSILRFCTSRRHLFSRAFDAYNLFFRRRRQPDSPRPDGETFTILLTALVKRFGKPPACHVYLHSLRSLVKQMKAYGIIPDAFTINWTIKAYSKCLQMDDAIRTFTEMGLYGCDPNEYSYGYIVKGLCEKGRVEEGFKYFKEMREKQLVPTKSVYMALISSLVLQGGFEEGINVMFDMLDNGFSPDLLTYRTVLEGLCRDGRVEDAFGLLEELRMRKGAMDSKTHSNLLDGLHWLCQPRD